MELFCILCTAEHAWWGLLATEYHGNLLTDRLMIAQISGLEWLYFDPLSTQLRSGYVDLLDYLLSGKCLLLPSSH